jgi:hypothetical protein
MATLAVLARAPLLSAVGRLLVVEDPLEPADAIVFPEWTQTAGALEAVDLVRAGFATRIAVMVNDLDPATQELIRRGLLDPDRAIWAVSAVKELGVSAVEQIRGTEGTESEGNELPRWCDEHNVRSIILITTPDHSRRTRRVVTRSMRGHQTKVMVHLTRYVSFDANRWWWSRGGVRTELVEFQKLLLDAVRHPLS